MDSINTLGDQEIHRLLTEINTLHKETDPLYLQITALEKKMRIKENIERLATFGYPVVYVPGTEGTSGGYIFAGVKQETERKKLIALKELYEQEERIKCELEREGYHFSHTYTQATFPCGKTEHWGKKG